MDTEQIRDLLSDFDNSSLVKLKIKKEDFSIELEKSVSPAVAVATPVSVASLPIAGKKEPEIDADALSIVSPMVGTFYSAPSPDSPDFVKIGDEVRKGQTVAIIEAMKIMNDVEAEFDCKIVDILVKNGQVVEYEMPLFIVEKL